MAYNREWDRGKDAWNNTGAWNTAGDSRGIVRDREDDYYNDGKRRKFNGGGYQNQGYDNTQAYTVDASYEADHTNFPQGSYNQQQQPQQQRGGPSSNFPKKRLVPSEPSPHVIFLGLDPDSTEADLQSYLSSHGCSVETVTIIRERSSGTSKGFGFAQFSSTEHAKAFVDPLFPYIQVPPPASHGHAAAVAFFKALESGAPHNGRRVKIDYSQSASPHEKGRFNRGNVNDGTRDIGNAQGPVLLFRGLDPLSGPQAIHQAMRLSSGPGKEGAKGMKRIILIKDKVTLASFGFAFVEFVDIASSSAVLGATMSPQIHPAGFRISDRPVAASFANPDSFQPVVDVMLRDEACITSSLCLGGVEGTYVRYWDETSTIAVLEFQVQAPTPAVSTAATKDKKEKKKKEATKVTVAVAPSALPISSKPVTLSFASKVKLPVGKVKPLALGSFSEDAGDGDNSEPEAGILADKATGSKKVAPLVASKKIANNITKWNQVQEELTYGPTSIAATPAIVSKEPGPLKTPEMIPVENDFEFSDVQKMSCLLCARQFKSMDQLKRHNKESDLHKKNFKDTQLREVAREKVKVRQQESGEQPKYRDRASERRVMFNQPEAPTIEKDGPSNGKHIRSKQTDGPPVPPSPPPPAINPGQDSSNVGNKLLKMMGWTEGTGLGSTGEGRVDPIKTALYAEGAGLGASKGKDISKLTEGYSGYVSMAQDSARERYGTKKP